MKLKELQLFVAENITYKNWEFYVKEKNGVMFLQIQFDAPDNFNPAKIERQYCRKWQLSEWMTPTEVVQTCWAAVTRAELHEAAETFKYKGFAIFDTHINVEALADVCDAGHYEHRGEPPKQNTLGKVTDDATSFAASLFAPSARVTGLGVCADAFAEQG